MAVQMCVQFQILNFFTYYIYVHNKHAISIFCILLIHYKNVCMYMIMYMQIPAKSVYLSLKCLRKVSNQTQKDRKIGRKWYLHINIYIPMTDLIVIGYEYA